MKYWRKVCKILQTINQPTNALFINVPNSHKPNKIIQFTVLNETQALYPGVVPNGAKQIPPKGNLLTKQLVWTNFCMSTKEVNVWKKRSEEIKTCMALCELKGLFKENNIHKSILYLQDGFT